MTVLLIHGNSGGDRAYGQNQDEMTVLLIHGEPAAVIAPYGHERRPGAAAEIRFDQTAPPEARLVLTDTWGGSIRMSTGEFRQLAREGVSQPLRRDGADRRILAVNAPARRARVDLTAADGSSARRRQCRPSRGAMR